ncbi:nucleotidyltransferase [Sorangium sp. So ce1078]|uniref:nucleotidyltransferase n=1 Tax=Sorangium sp. So ce1078 TaxID=3133329 RepID=UPI003F60E4C1
MRTNRDFRDLFAELNAAGAEYLVVGAHALAAHGHVRATKDLDVWVRCSADNAALCAFGAPVAALSLEELGTPGIVFQIGVEPVRVDILTSIDGVSFDDAWQARVPSRYDDQPVQVISREHLIANKLASGRLQDLADVERLGGLVPEDLRKRRS